VAILLAPTVIFALQFLQGDWPGGTSALLASELLSGIDPRWLAMELAALVTCVGLLCWLRLPFLILPTAFILWIIGMDVVPSLIMQGHSFADISMTSSVEEMRKGFTLIVGLVLVTLGLYADLNRHPVGERFAFWAYFAGLMAFCTAVPLLLNNQWPGKLMYLVVHVGLVMIGAILGRRVFEVFGGIGITLVMVDMAWEIFRDGLAVVSALTLLSLALLAIGLWWWRHEPAVSARLRDLLPRDMQKWIDTRAA
jgi:hypothetical protein